MDEISLQEDNLIEEIVFTIAKAITDYPDKYYLVNCPLDHVFTPGLYSREVTMPADTIIVSEKHLTEHQFCVLEGVVSVWTKENGWIVYQAGDKDVTKAGTQRVLITTLQTVWVTFHANPKGFTTADEIYDDIIDKRDMDLIHGRFKNNVYIPSEKLLNI